MVSRAVFFLAFQSTAKKLEDQESSEKSFGNVPLALLKVVAMMDGDVDYGLLLFEINPFGSHGIYLTFVFMMTIVLLNLLNGIAVNDIQAIQNRNENFCAVKFPRKFYFTKKY